MIKLLVANFFRAVKNKLFWCLCGATALVSLIMIVSAMLSGSAPIDGVICMCVVAVEIAAAVFISIFFGTEYGDGTIRNKLVVGHDRRQIYFANLLTAVVCGLVMTAAYILPVVILGFPLVGLPSVTAIQVMAVGIVTLFAFCSLFTMVSMMYSNKAGATVINLVLAFLLLAAASFLLSILNAPEYYTVFTDEGQELVRNSNYIDGVARTILQALCDLLPSGQAMQFIQGISSPLWVFPLYSVGVCATCTAVGAVVFYKKDIK